jgi:hypothetical protein
MKQGIIVIISMFLYPILLMGQEDKIHTEAIELRAKDKEVIASHVVGIVNNVVNLIQDPKDEDEIGANILGLFTNILGCIFAATKRGIINEEELEMLFMYLDEEIIEQVTREVLLQIYPDA